MGMGDRCQVDFYLLGSPSLSAGHLACRLALMAWERGHSICIVTGDEKSAKALDELLWAYPEGRFLPHELSEPGASPSPVTISASLPADASDVVINLTDKALEGDLNFQRLLEIVPHREPERKASRQKFRTYRSLGLDPCKHDIN